MTPETPIADCLVIDLSSGIAGGYCTKILADGGADIVKVEDPTGDPLRRHTATGQPPVAGDDAPLFQYLHSSKRSIIVCPSAPDELDALEDLIRSADGVVWSPGSALATTRRLRPEALATLAPGIPILAITPFGLHGPWADRAVTDFTLQAWSGGTGQRGVTESPPVTMGGEISAWLAGMTGAATFLTGRRWARRTGVGDLIDLSALEATVLNTTMYPVTFNTVAGQPVRPVRMRNLPDIHRTSDGWVGFMVVTGQQWLDFATMLGREDWLVDESLLQFNVRNSRRAELVAAVDAWTAARTTDEIIELASLLRLPVAPVGTGATIPTMDQFASRGQYRKNPRGGFLEPDVPYTLGSGAGRRQPTPAPRLGADAMPSPRRPRRRVPQNATTAGRPFEDLRIADFTAFWAGPVVGHYLGLLGADVIHVESAQRPDGLRFMTTKPFGSEDWWEWCPLFHAVNANKRDLSVDMNREEGRALARRLIEHCDVVIENFSPRVMENWGLDYDRLAAANPGLVMLRMPAFGLTGPWRDRVGYAQTMEQVSGLAWVTGDPDGVPETPNGPCDPIGGFHGLIALLLALEYRDRTGRGMLIECPQVGGALAIAAEQAIEASATGTVLGRSGNRSPRSAPRGLYRCADDDESGPTDRWVAIDVADDSHWGALRGAIGDPGWASDPGLDSVAGRLRRHDLLDDGLAAWCAGQTADTVVDRLWRAGVPVAKVMLGHEQDTVPQLQARAFFETVPHAVAGPGTHSTLAARFGRLDGPLHLRPAPLLGEHNEEILTALGLDRAEIDRLTEWGVIGGRP